MEKLQLTCPKCKSENVKQLRQYDWKDVESLSNTKEIMKMEFEEDFDSKDRYTVECICNDCNHIFDTTTITSIENVVLRYPQAVILIKGDQSI